MYRETIEGIDAIISRINTHPDYSCRRKAHAFNAVRVEASKHSVSIEFAAGSVEGKLSRKRRSDAIENIEKAREYLAREGLSLGSLSGLGNIIEPEGQPFKNFRNTDVMFGGFAPPSPGEVIYRMKNLVDILNSWESHPVIRASEAHLSFVMIHPYKDGNGRAARLIQNFCLEQRGYPPALMHEGERAVYLKILGRALSDRYAGHSSMYSQSVAEQRFHEFIAAKVLDSAVKIESELKRRNRYMVDFDTSVDKPALYNVATRIRNKARRDTREGVSVSLKKDGNKHWMEITGEIDLREIRKTLESSGERLGAGFRIKKG